MSPPSKPGLNFKIVIDKLAIKYDLETIYYQKKYTAKTPVTVSPASKSVFKFTNSLNDNNY